MRGAAAAGETSPERARAFAAFVRRTVACPDFVSTWLRGTASRSPSVQRTYDHDRVFMS